MIHVYDARGAQLAWSQGLPSIAGDARTAAHAAGRRRNITIELHDALYRGGEPGLLPLEDRRVSLSPIWPIRWRSQQGANATFEFAAHQFAGRCAGHGHVVDRSTVCRDAFSRRPGRPACALLSGSRPAVMVTDHAEIVEAPRGDKLQEIPAAPVAINGRIAKPGEQDRYRLAVTPGDKLRFDVLARRAGTALDGVLSIQNEQGAELAAQRRSSGHERSGPRFQSARRHHARSLSPCAICKAAAARISCIGFRSRQSVSPTFRCRLADERYQVPKDGAALARVRVERAGYNGPIKLEFANLPASVSITGNEIPAGATEALVTLSAPGLSPAQSLTTVLGTSTEPNTAIKRAALIPADVVNKHQPWLRDEVALAVTTPSPLGPGVGFVCLGRETRRRHGAAGQVARQRAGERRRRGATDAVDHASRRRARRSR